MCTMVQCPVCSSTNFDLHAYESMMVLSEQLAFLTLRCPECQTVVTSMCVLPDDMAAQVVYAAKKLGAGMGHQTPSV